jgi:hypothetical protein
MGEVVTGKYAFAPTRLSPGERTLDESRDEVRECDDRPACDAGMEVEFKSLEDLRE